MRTTKAALLLTLSILTPSILTIRPVFAGVVLSETEVRKGIGTPTTLHKTIYVQGKKQKIATGNSETIIDLDRGHLFIVDSTSRSYVELPFPAAPTNDPGAPGLKVNSVTLNKTGRKRSIGGLPCDEYQGVNRTSSIDVIINQCISSAAPGASEVAAFQHALSSTLAGDPKRGSEKASGTIALDQKSSIKPRQGADLPLESASRRPLVTTRTQVNAIRVTELPPATFEPPAGFHKLIAQTGKMIEV